MNLKAGQWVKCVNIFFHSEQCTIIPDKWYQIQIDNFDKCPYFILFDKFNRIRASSEWLEWYFDLNNPLDYNPDEVV